jgi:hypothetical protein
MARWRVDLNDKKTLEHLGTVKAEETMPDHDRTKQPKLDPWLNEVFTRIEHERTYLQSLWSGFAETRVSIQRAVGR